MLRYAGVDPVPGFLPCAHATREGPMASEQSEARVAVGVIDVGRWYEEKLKCRIEL